MSGGRRRGPRRTWRLLLVHCVLVQAVVALLRPTTSYRALDLGPGSQWLGLLSVCISVYSVEVRVSDTSLVLHPDRIEPFDRGNGVRTLPYVGRWNAESNQVTTGVTEFAPGTGIPLHTHNVEESVLILEGEATATIGDEDYDLVAGDATWVPAGIPHRFAHRGTGRMRIYWMYGGRDVTRTIVATGETFEHLSDADRGATADRPA